MGPVWRPVTPVPPVTLNNRVQSVGVSTVAVSGLVPIAMTDMFDASGSVVAFGAGEIVPVVLLTVEPRFLKVTDTAHTDCIDRSGQ